MDKMKHILIVDDVTTNLKCAAEVLENHFRLSMAKSGEQAINFLKKAKPDLILLDVRMPDMDGYQTLEIIKSNPDTANIPVVFLTVEDQKESEIRGLKMGAMDFISKPFDPTVMLSRIHKILQIENLRKNLSVSSRKDALTGLWNRKYMEDDIERFFDGGGQDGVFLIFDIDNFKMINDLHGHIMGDGILVRFAEILQNSIGPRDAVARIGGDEFVVFLKGEYTAEEIREYCGVVNSSMESEIADIVGDGTAVTLSIGVALAPSDGYDFESLYSKADKALYHVKENGKNGCYFYRLEREREMVSVVGDSSSSVDMDKLEQVVSERSSREGAYRVEYDGFKHIYQFISRSIGRTGQTAQMLLFTLTYEGSHKHSPEVLNKAMTELERAIVVSLRQGDVTTQYSSFQYVVLLMSVSSENGEKIAKRICDTWEKLNEYEGIALEYSIKAVGSKSE